MRVGVGLCSSNKRAANYVSLGETDWESGDFERAKYILNFGSNFYEAHQGAIHAANKPLRRVPGRGLELQVVNQARGAQACGTQRHQLACHQRTRCGSTARTTWAVTMRSSPRSSTFSSTG